MTATPDYVEVGRTAHELEASHGAAAHVFAAKRAAQALAEGHAEEGGFWKAVEACLKPRNSN